MYNKKVKYFEQEGCRYTILLVKISKQRSLKEIIFFFCYFFSEMIIACNKDKTLIMYLHTGSKLLRRQVGSAYRIPWKGMKKSLFFCY